MTTAQSPTSVLKAQAEKIAAALKAAERGETITEDRGGKIAAARTGESITFAVAMDDKILKIEMPWAVIGAADEAQIADYILRQMREAAEGE